MGKLLGALPLGQLLLARYAIQAILLLPLVYAGGKTLDLSARVWRLTVVRTLLHIVSLGAFFAALRFLPMAETVAICFVMPFILLLLGRLTGEQRRPAPPRRLRGRLRRHAHGGPAQLPRRRRAGAPAAPRRGPLLLLHADHPRHRPRHRPGGAAGRQRPRRHRHPRPARPSRRRPRLARTQPRRRLRHRLDPPGRSSASSAPPRTSSSPSRSASPRRARSPPCSTSSSPSPP